MVLCGKTMVLFHLGRLDQWRPEGYVGPAVGSWHYMASGQSIKCLSISGPLSDLADISRCIVDVN